MASMHYDAAGYPMFPGGREFETQFGPDDLNRLQELFDDCRDECHLAIDCERTRILGRALVRLYAQGQHDPDLIRALLIPSFKERS